jgi:hypothetical protein
MTTMKVQKSVYGPRLAEVEPLSSADARHEFWVLWRSFG